MNRLARASAAVLLVSSATLQQRPSVLDAFESANGWRSTAGDAPSLRISTDSGFRGRSIRLDFDAGDRLERLGIKKAFNFTLPPNYELAFRVRGEGSVNALELGLADATGENRWTSDLPVNVARGWSEIVRKKRQFAPRRGKELTRVSSVDIGVTVTGKGSIWLDELQLRPREPDRPYSLTPNIAASSEAMGFEARRALDGDTTTLWRSTSGAPPAPASPPPKPAKNAPPAPVVSVPPNGKQALVVDFLKSREFSGLRIDWEDAHHATDYAVEFSPDGRTWEPRYHVTGGNGGRDYVFLPESDTRFIRLTLERGPLEEFAIRDITVEPLEWAATKNAFLASISRDALPGSYPKYLSGNQSYWTIAGADRDDAEVLLNEEGMVEAKKGGFSIEPFVYTDGRLFTWSDVATSQSLADDRYPEPSVAWDGGGWSLSLAPLAVLGGRDSSIAYLQYRLTNKSRGRRAVQLFLAVRPFQVVPPWASLSGTQAGGAAAVQQLAFENGSIQVNGEIAIVPLTPSPAFGATTFDQGNVVDFLRAGHVPAMPNARDSFGQASGALAYSTEVDSGAAAVFELAIPLHPASVSQAERERVLGLRAPRDHVADARRGWRDALERTTIELPSAANPVVHSLYANAGYLLVNRDGAALNGGARFNDRVRIADAAMQAAALLRIGRSDVVRELVDWYASAEMPNGVTHVSPSEPGAFIYAVAEYFRFTHDRTTLDRLWPTVHRAAAYIDTLRQQRRTAEYQTGDRRVFYGLLPPSASQDGVSKPTHDYADDFLALRGLKDAVELARALSRPEEIPLAVIRDEFRRELVASMQFALVQQRIDFLPRAADAAEADPASAALVVAPLGEAGQLPETVRQAVGRTLERSGTLAMVGGDGRATGARQAYSPNEIRRLGAMVRLGNRDMARALLDGFLKDQRPAAWHQWGEAVWSDPSAPRPAGDMPNAVAGAAFMSAVLDMFAFERESDSTLVLGAGIPESWVTERPGVTVRRLATHYGLLTYTIRNENGNARVSMAAGLTMPPGGIVVHSPFTRPVRETRVNGVPTPPGPSGGVVVRSLPAEVVFRP
jgi:hypothetical protein